MTPLTREYLDLFYEGRSHRPGSPAYATAMNGADWRWRKMTHAERETALRYMRGETGERGRTSRAGPSRDAAFDKAKLMREIDREQKLAARKKLAELRARIKAAMAERRGGRASVRSFCEAERAQARARIADLREKLRLEARRLAAAERLEARGRCERARRAPGLEIARLRGELEAERRHLAAMRRIERGARARRPPIAKASVRRGESDDEVRQNIPPELLGLFERVKRQIKGSARKSRTEEFLEYVEANPGEEFEGIEDETERMIREHERALRSGAYRDPIQRTRRTKALRRA